MKKNIKFIIIGIVILIIVIFTTLYIININNTEIILNQKNLEITIGGEEKILLKKTKKHLLNKKITWSSSNNNVAIVNDDGVVKGLSKGNTIITARTSNGKEVQCNVIVNELNCPMDSKIHFINTGGSDAFLIESCGHYGLVDASNAYNDGTKKSVSGYQNSVEHVTNYLAKIMGCNGINCKGKLDFVIATHSHSDHIGGMVKIASVFTDSNTKYFYRKYIKTRDDVTKDWDNQGYYDRAVKAMENANAKMIEITDNDLVFNFYDFNIFLMNTNKVGKDELEKGLARSENKNAIIELIVHRNGVKTLLASDMEEEDERRVQDKIGKVDIFKVGHHSWNWSNSNEFIEKLKPNNMIITNNTIIDKDRICYGLKINPLAKVYLTSSVNDAIIAVYSQDGYQLMNDEEKIVLESDICNIN